MDNYELTLRTLFEKYGTLEKFEDSNFNYYFILNTRELFDKENLLYYMGNIKLLLVIKEKGECIIYCFRISSKDEIGKNVLEIINKINISIEYGKYFLDSDGDVDWEYKFDLDCISSEDIHDLLISFVRSVLNFGVMINEIKIERNNIDINE